MSTESVPAYFADFKEENARQHGELNAKIERVRGDLSLQIERTQATLIKWIVATMLGGITAVSGLMFTLAYLMQSA